VLKLSPAAPPVFRPQPTPHVLQKKAVTPQPQPAVATKRAPDAYRPQSMPGVLQAKTGAGSDTGRTAERSAQSPPTLLRNPTPPTGLPSHTLSRDTAATARPAQQPQTAARPGAGVSAVQPMRGGGVVQRASYSVDFRLDNADDTNRIIEDVRIIRNVVHEGGSGGIDGGHKTGAVSVKAKWALLITKGKTVGETAGNFNQDEKVKEFNNEVNTSGPISANTLRAALENQINTELEDVEEIEPESASINRKKGGMVSKVTNTLVDLQSEKEEKGQLTHTQKEKRMVAETKLLVTSQDIFTPKKTQISREKLDNARTQTVESRKNTALYLNSPTSSIIPPSPEVKKVAMQIYGKQINIEPKPKLQPQTQPTTTTTTTANTGTNKTKK
jgi:hypothetical protein